MKILTKLIPLLFIVFMLSSCMGSSPSKVAEEFLNAMAHKDFDKARQLSTEGSAKAISLIETFSAFSDKEEEIKAIKITRNKVDGEYATVWYQLEGENELKLKLKKDSKRGWLVMFSKADIPGGKDEEGVENIDVNVNIDPEDIDEVMEKMGEGLDTLGQKLGEGLKKLGEGLEKMGKELQKDTEN